MNETAYLIRPAAFRDAAGIVRLVRAHPDELVPRSVSDVLQNIDRFFVAEADGRIVGVVSWGILPELGTAQHPSVELKTLAVDREWRGRGIGAALVRTALARIAELRPEHVLALTFVPEFFRRFGFVEVAKDKFMHKLYTGCVNCTRYDNPFTCPEIAMAKPMAGGADAGATVAAGNSTATAAGA